VAETVTEAPARNDQLAEKQRRTGIIFFCSFISVPGPLCFTVAQVFCIAMKKLLLFLLLFVAAAAPAQIVTPEIQSDLRLPVVFPDGNGGHLAFFSTATGGIPVPFVSR
jgi:hypothetical protein